MFRNMFRFRWRSGVGEALGFAASAMILVILVVAIMAISNYAIHTQQLTTACYAAGRAAAVSSDDTLANQRAQAVLRTIYGSAGVLGGESKDTDGVWYELRASEGWHIGKMMTITVYQHINYIFPVPEMNLQKSLAMMIEDETVKK